MIFQRRIAIFCADLYAKSVTGFLDAENSNFLPSENKVFIDKWYVYLYNYFVTVKARLYSQIKS